VKIHVGTSGFSYQHWKEIFYPSGVPQRQWLEFYAQNFDCVEINSSFYRLPRESVVESWQRRTPKTFTFVMKGSRAVTHISRLKDCRESVELFYESIRPLKRKIGAVLWQLPPGLKQDRALLESFLNLLPARPNPVLEFRNPSWFTEDVYALMRTKRTVFCMHDMRSSGCPDVVTAPIIYLRFHGPTGRYRGGYPDRMLKDRATWIQASGASEVYAFFNNDSEGHAVKNATTLRRMLGG
jgi:uncharacterized protein YecE (DUF72 family)